MMIRLALITFAICAGIFIGAGTIQRLVLTDKWTGIVPLIRVLVFGAFLRALLSVTMWLSVAVGRPQVNFAVNGSRLAIMAIAIVPLSRWLGLSGVALSVNLGLAGALAVCFVSARRDLQ
jgi:PST family polysaccharide transporter